MLCSITFRLQIKDRYAADTDFVFYTWALRCFLTAIITQTTIHSQLRVDSVTVEREQ